MNIDNILTTNKKYSIIYADPPWKHNVWKEKKSRTSDAYYNVMEYDDLLNLPVQNISDKNCALFMWVTPAFLEAGIRLANKWGFTYKTIAFVWVKINRKSPTLFWGMGHYTRSNAEICILCTKGHLTRLAKNVHQIIQSQVQLHSRKPDEARERIVKLFGDLPRIELFATERVENWDTFGDGRFHN